MATIYIALDSSISMRLQISDDSSLTRWQFACQLASQLIQRFIDTYITRSVKLVISYFNSK